MIINVRGTSGSGKTFAVRELMARSAQPPVPFASSPKTNDIKAYECRLPSGHPFYVLGTYERTCGGCDSIRTQDEACDLVRHYSAKGHVVFEGLLITGLFSRYLKLDRELQPIPFIWALLDTPLDVCLARVQARRDARGAKTLFNPQNTIGKYIDKDDVNGIYQKCVRAGVDVRWVDYTKATDVLWGWLTQ